MNRSREEALEKIGPIKIIEALESSLLKAIEDNSKLEAEIEILNEQIEIDKDFIKQYQAQVKSLKARLGAAENVVNQSLPVVNYTDLDNLCSCVSEYREVLIKYGELKAGAGSAAVNVQDGVKHKRANTGQRTSVKDEKPTAPQACIITTDRLAECFHEIYERLAPEFNYKTRKKSAVPWRKIPKNNRRLMVAVCEEIISQHITPQTCGKCGRSVPDSKANKDGCSECKGYGRRNQTYANCTCEQCPPELTDEASTLLDQSDKDVAEGRTQSFNTVDGALDALDEIKEKEDD